MSSDPMFVKICGLRDVASTRVAVDAGADALGFILAKSRRQVTPEEIRAIREELRATYPVVPPLVGVVVNANPEAIAGDVDASGVDMIQLSGDEGPAILASIAVPVIKALRFPPGISIDDALRTVSVWLDGPHPATHLIVEGHAEGSYGGTGTLADWSLVAEVARRYPVILAGGLAPENVGDAVRAVSPLGVDVSSGVETDGSKDHGKIRAFIDLARQSPCYSSR